MSHSNKQHTLDTFQELKGQHVLINRKVLRFIAIALDQYDYLYIMWDGREVSYCTILDRMSQLKDRIDKSDYDEMVRISSINHMDSADLWMPRTDEDKAKTAKQANRARCIIEKQLNEVKDLDMLSEVCWELN